jgi:DNA uptake protein ComE-like DNA-binding protein
MRRQRGGALLIVLAVLAGLVSLVVAFAATQRASTREVQARLDRERAKRIAIAAVQRAMAEIALVDANSVTQLDEWYTLGESNGQYFTIGEGRARIQILDEGSMINLNTATQEQLEQLGLTAEQIDSLLDWREEGQEPRPEGAKDEYYNNLPTPYNASLAPLKSLDELLLIKGWTPRDIFELPEERNTNEPLVSGSADLQPLLINLATVWSRSPWLNEQGQARLNVNTATQQQLVQQGLTQQLAQAIIQRRNQQGTFTGLGQVLQTPGLTLQNCTPILNNLATDTSQEVTGRLNLNTASEAALNSIPDMTPDMSSAIVSRQQQGFASLGDLTSIPGVTLQWLQQNVDRFAVGSRAFRVRVLGTYGDVNYPLEAVVQLEGTTPRLAGLFEQPYGDMDTRWTWDTEPSTEIILAEGR